jgi:hypothetical protein
MTEKISSPMLDLEQHYAQVPTDFPRPNMASALSGFQAKLPMVEYRGKLYVAGCTPPELYQSWHYCEGMAAIFVGKCRRNQHGKYAHLNEEGILDQYCVRLLRTRWATEEELKWVIRRTAALLKWPVPPNSLA